MCSQEILKSTHQHLQSWKQISSASPSVQSPQKTIWATNQSPLQRRRGGGAIQLRGDSREGGLASSLLCQSLIWTENNPLFWKRGAQILDLKKQLGPNLSWKSEAGAGILGAADVGGSGVSPNAEPNAS